MLPLARRLQGLDVSHNQIGTRGFEALAAAIRGGAAPELKRIVFRGNRKGDVAQLVEACRLRGITVDGGASGGRSLTRNGDGRVLTERRGSLR